MQCLKCGFDNKLNNDFCANCGNTLEGKCFYANINKIILFLPLSALALSLLATYAVLNSNTSDGVTFFVICDIYLFIMCVNKIIKIMTTVLWVNYKKVFGKVGFLSTTSLDAPLDKINDVMISQNFSGKIFNYSRIVISTSSSKYVYDFISNAKEFKEKLNMYSEDFKYGQNKNVTTIQTNKYDDLDKLKKLLDDKVITKSEFDAEKKKIFNKD